MTVSAGPTGVSLDFTHDARSNSAVMDELGRIIINANRVAPGGACVFFPSFKYADAVCARWEQTGALTTMRSVKDVYREPRDASALEQCLRDYAESVRRAKESGTNRGGAILLCVVGGKLSEGINFKDELGRLVIMVGLPYVNVADAELKARMDHLDTGIGNQGRGRAYYEALCMRGVNQSIGRAIRHVGDYACILLCDKRWGVYGSNGGSTDANKTKAANALPDWIRARLRVPEKYGHVQLALGQFFRARAEAAARR
jgi:chromosome transmission fidelity protein 1